MALNITILGTTNKNPGDTISDIGIQYLTRQLFPGAYTYQVRCHTSASYVVPSDVLIVSATPWLWHNSSGSQKVQTLKSIIKQTNARIKIALGVGSCYLHDFKFSPNDAKEAWNVFGGFNLVTCRDEIAARLCKEAGVKHLLMQCPSTLAAHAMGIFPDKRAKHRHIHIYQDTRKCFISEYLEGKHEYYDDIQMGFIKEADQVYCISKSDFDSFKERYKDKNVKWSNDPRKLLRVLALYHKVTSMRVHGALPALSLNCNTTIIPLDSRSLSASNFGATVYGKLFEPEIINKLQPVGEIIRRIRNNM